MCGWQKTMFFVQSSAMATHHIHLFKTLLSKLLLKRLTHQKFLFLYCKPNWQFFKHQLYFSSGCHMDQILFTFHQVDMHFWSWLTNMKVFYFRIRIEKFQELLTKTNYKFSLGDVKVWVEMHFWKKWILLKAMFLQILKQFSLHKQSFSIFLEFSKKNLKLSKFKLCFISKEGSEEGFLLI